ncbi:MAG TPA: DNRLRE domain-containing protein, partial [Mycobacteriales bacterium]|nr:DNRLRE domain-containing protein [Mycobacteriales bacterium]
MLGSPRRPFLLPGLTTAAVVASLVVPVATVPVAAAAPAPAPAQPAAGELPERRTASSATRRNADGSLTTTLYAAPVHYRAADGRWERIDRRLVDAGTAGAPDADGYRWRAAAHAFDARFADRAGADFVQLTVDGARFRLSAEGAAGDPGRADGPVVRYPAAFGRAELSYAVLATGLKSLLTLTGPDDPTSYTFRLAGPATGPPPTVRRRPDGSHEVFLPGRPAPLFVLDAPAAAEAGDGPQVRPPDPAAKARLEVRPDGRDLVLTLGLDPAWLRAPGRRFPVELDPTFTVQPDVEDAFFGMPNYGAYAWPDLYVGTDGTAWRTAVRFDLAGLPAGAVTDAKLGLYNTSCIWLGEGTPYCGARAHTLDAHRMTAAWTTASNASQLAFDAAPAGTATLAAGTGAGWMSWPITATVQAWLNGTQPNHGLLVKRRTEELNASGPVFAGRRYTGLAERLPKLEVTIANDAVDLAPPTTVHGNGAELSWTRWAGTAAFQRYEVHRSASRTFVPDDRTLLTTITDPAVTTYRDTTASGDKEFTYRVVANGDASVPRTVTLPPDGQARTVIQPDPAAGQATFVYRNSCSNYGRVDKAWVGTTTGAGYRGLFRFDLRAIPPKAKVTDAKATLWKIGGPLLGLTVEARRLTRAWKEGSEDTACGDGVSWTQTQSGESWTTPGGDAEPTPVATRDVPAGEAAGYHTFGLTSAVQSWVDGTTANHGLLLRPADESVPTNDRYIYYSTDDETVSPGLRPKLEVSYEDGSVTEKPRVELAAPAAGARVSGSAVTLAASAGDDRRVESVEFFVGGTSVGRDTTAPFEVSWNSSGTANGQRAVTLTATDDAGNVTTTPPVDIVVDNTQPPSGSITAPAAGATVTTPVTLSANPTDDVGVSRVEFLVDGVRVGPPVTAAPWTVQWNPLDPLARIFDGPHTVTAAITDTSGQQVVTAGRSITVSNAGTTRYRAGVELNGAVPEDDVPPVVTENPAAPAQDPYADATARPDGTLPGSRNRSFTDAPVNDAGTPPSTCPIGAYCPSVTVTNTSTVTWTGTGPEVWYTWYAPNGALLYQGVATATVEPDLRAGRSAAPVRLVIRPPKLPPGAERGEFRLRVDLYDRATGTWYAARGNAAEDNPVIVAKALRGSLGLERFWPY